MTGRSTSIELISHLAGGEEFEGQSPDRFQAAHVPLLGTRAWHISTPGVRAKTPKCRQKRHGLRWDQLEGRPVARSDLREVAPVGRCDRGDAETFTDGDHGSVDKTEITVLFE